MKTMTDNSSRTQSGHVTLLVSLSLVSLAEVAAGACATVTTFNAALATRVERYQQRRALIADALAAEGSDVLCLQELWYEDDMRHIIDDLKSIYPHHYSDLHTGTNRLKDDSRRWYHPAQSACSASEFVVLTVWLLPCAISNGCLGQFGESSEAGLDCLADKCGHVLRHDSIGAECLSCLVISSSSASDISDRCHKVFGSDLRLNHPGLLLMSKRELTNKVKSSYFPGRDMTLHRGYLQADVKDIGKIVCTHLTSVFPHYWEYDLPFSSYEEQNQAEINVTRERLGSTNHILAGDFNTGKAVPSPDPEKDLGAEAPQSQALLTHYNYDTDTYLSGDGRCTYCKSNPIVSTHNVAIDDVLIMGDAFSSVTKQRVLDQTDPVLSDHYGVRARMCT